MISLDSRSLPLHGRRLIEASAGTGKTYTITAIFLRLLLGHGEEGTRPLTARRVQEILIVTYTRAATEELRGRIRKRLRAACLAFESGTAPPGDALIAEMLRASTDRAADLQRLRLAEMELDLASIFTIHGFASRVLNRNAFESRISFAAEIADNDAEVVAQTIRDLWRERVYPLARLPASLLLADIKPADFVATVRTLLGKHELQLHNEPPLDWEVLLRRIDDGAGALLAHWRSAGSGVREAMSAVRLNKAGALAFAAAAARLDAPGAEPATLDRALVHGLSRDFLASQLNRSVKANRLPELAILELAQEVMDAGGALRARLLADAIRLARTRLAALKDRTGALGYEDLLRLLHEGIEAPGGERLAAAIRQQYPVALIDEFQDTDPLQWSVFSSIYATADSALFLVGDPKQAIYAFRGADVQAYLQVRRDTPALYSLDTNYRSVAALVSAVNGLFALRGDGNPFLAGSDMPFHAVGASGAPEQQPLLRSGQAMAPLQVLHIATARPIPGGRYRAQIARAAADHLAGLLVAGAAGELRLGARNLQAGDVACLVRDRHDARQLSAELGRRGIPHVQRSRDSVFAGPCARDLYQLLAAVLDPASERLLRAALGSALLGRTAAELEQLLADEEAFAREQAQFLGLGEDLRLFGVQTMLRRLLFAYGVPARLLARGGGERTLTDCLHLVELLQSERELLDSDEALLARFAHCIANHDGEQETQQLRLESDADRVQIVTLHASKGLEYPVVYLPFMAVFKPAKEPFFHDPATLQACYDLACGDEALVLAEHERLAEDMRLLYVGLTRAAHLCVLGIADTTRGNSKSSYLGRTALGYLIGADDGDTAAAIARLVRLPGVALVDAATLPFAALARAAAPATELRSRRFATAIERDWQSSSYSALTRHAAGRAEQVFRQPELLADERAAGDEERNLFTFPRGARHGSFLHGLLERIDFQQSAQAPATQRLLQRSLVQEGYAADWLPVLGAMLDDVLGCALDGAGLRLRGLRAAQRVTEMGFEFPLAQLDAARLNAALRGHEPLAREAPPLAFGAIRGMLTGFIDLVFEHEGRYFVADFKSNHLGGTTADYRPERLRASIVEHRYDLQYVLYTVALSRLLRLRLGAAYDYDTHVGGVYYLYLRGMRADAGAAHGVFHTRPARALVEALDAIFDGEPADVA